MWSPGGYLKLAERHLVDKTPIVDGSLCLSTEQIRARCWPAGAKSGECEHTRSHQQCDAYGHFFDHLETLMVTVTFR